MILRKRTTNLFFTNLPKNIILFLSLFLASNKKISAEVFEQAFFFYHTPYENTANSSNDLNFFVNMNISYISATESFDAQGRAVPLFGKYGSIDFEEFANNSISTELTSNSLFENVKFTKTKALQTAIKDNWATADKKLYGSGSLSGFECILSGKIFFKDQAIYLGIDIPIRSLECKKIKLCNSNYQESLFANFLNVEFDNVLRENGFTPLSHGYEATGISDVNIKVGWQGDFRPVNHKMIQYLWSNLSCGVTLPFSTMFQPNQNYFFHVPLGFGGSLGTTLRYEAGLDMKYGLGAMFFGENVSFFKKHNQYKVMHHPEMQLFNFIKEYNVKEDRGSYWTLGGQITSKFLLDTVKVNIGYSYHSQEQSYLEINREICNTEYLYDKVAIKKFLDKFSPTPTPIPLEIADREEGYKYAINDYLINQNPKLKRAYLHIAHCGIVVEPNHELEWCQQAKFILAFHKPFYGKASFAGQGFSSQATVGVQLNF